VYLPVFANKRTRKFKKEEEKVKRNRKKRNQTTKGKIK